MKEQIIESQKSIIENLARWELSIGELYGKFAMVCPDLAVFWAKLAKEEQQHAALLKTLLKKIDKGHLIFNLGKFEWDRIEQDIHEVLRALNAIHTEEITAQEALKTAIRIEGLMIESHFYSETDSDDPAFKHVAAALTNATRIHFEKLQQKLAEAEK